MGLQSRKAKPIHKGRRQKPEEKWKTKPILA
jgi:hypothetical protein